MRYLLLLLLLTLPASAQTPPNYRRDALRALDASDDYLMSRDHTDQQGREMNERNHYFVEKYRRYRKTESYVPVSVLQTNVTMAVIAKNTKASWECHRNIMKLRELVKRGR